MAESIYKNYFPSQAVSDLEKITTEYGLKIAKAIEKEWFESNTMGNNYSSSRYYNNKNTFHKLRLYARGEQGIQKYKDELSINGDLSYLNLDWKPVPIIPKFVDIVVNGMSERAYDVKAFSQDPYGVEKRTDYMQRMLDEMRTKDFTKFYKETFNVDLSTVPEDKLPETEEELELHMQLTYKQAVELAEEQAINVLLQGNNYDLIRKRVNYDLTVLGIGAVKTGFNKSEGATVEYVDPADLVYSYTDSPYFDDIYYVGEVKDVPINELVKQFPNLSESEIKDILNSNNQTSGRYSRKYSYGRETDNNKVQVLYFNYKTYMNDVYKVKETATGAQKAIEKDDTFNPPEEAQVNFMKLQRSVECLFEGAFIVGTDKIISWKKVDNMMRSKSDFNKVKMNYSITAPRMYNGRIESLVGRITGFADMIQLTHLKLQQVMSRLIPDGIYLDASEEHTSELQSQSTISYAVFCLKKKRNTPSTTKQSNERQ